MENFTRATFSIDEETRVLLEMIASKERDAGEPKNESRTLRKMIREKALQLGIEIPSAQSKSKSKILA